MQPQLKHSAALQSVIFTGECRSHILLFFSGSLSNKFPQNSLKISRAPVFATLLTSRVTEQRNETQTGWNQTQPYHKTSTLQEEERGKKEKKREKMDCSLRSGHNSSYQAKTEAPDITQSRRTWEEVRETPRVSTDLYILPPSPK